MTKSLIALLFLLLLAFTPTSCEQSALRVGSKKFTESVILGEMIAGQARAEGVAVSHFRELGGTQLVYQALLNGDIDIYPEYTGTIASEILAGRDIASAGQMEAALKEDGVLMSRPLGFNNTYALALTRDRAAELGVTTISDLLRHPDLKFGFSNEFLDREDGWKNLKRHYHLPYRNVKGLDHDLAYRQLKLGAIDVIDVYTTDAKIKAHDLLVLEDDLAYFPRYDGLLLYRADLPDRFPRAMTAIWQLEGEISEVAMMSANGRTVLEGEAEAQVAADFLKEAFGTTVEIERATVAGAVLSRTVEHLDLVRKSLIPAILLAIPLGILAAKWPRRGQFILAGVGIVQTIPALALLVMLMPAIAAVGLASVGLGSITAVVALFLYSLLPIVRNTYAGIQDVAGEFHESAAALGLPPLHRLLKIELPLAARSILAGVKTAAVINVGFATLGALIGAGGYGQPIITGIRLNDTGLILQGAIPAAVLALLVQGGFEAAERYLVPRGLRLRRAG